MAKTNTFFDLTKILEVPERWLTSLSIALEQRTEHWLQRCYKRDKLRDRIRSEEKVRLREGKELAKQQDFKPEKMKAYTDRMTEISDMKEGRSHDYEHER